MFYTTDKLDELIESLMKTNTSSFNRSRKYETETTDDGIVLTIETPGYNKNLIDVIVEDKMLIIKGKSNSGSLDGFKEKFSLSDKFNNDDIEASVVDGVLTVTVPYKEESKPRKVKVKVG